MLFFMSWYLANLLSLFLKEAVDLTLVTMLYLVFTIFEFALPAQRGQSIWGRLRNLVYASLLILIGILFTLFITWLLPAPPVLPKQALAVSAFYIFIYAVLTDFIFYWYHRAEHTFRFMWAIHELHHSEAELNVTTSLRTYWFERPIQALLIVLPIRYFIGIDPLAAALLPLVLMLWLFFTHANLRLSLGWLTPVICGPQLHRIHHSALPEHLNKNFAQFFPVLDILFGTYYAPRPNEFPPTGLHGVDSNMQVMDVLVRPLSFWFPEVSTSLVNAPESAPRSTPRP